MKVSHVGHGEHLQYFYVALTTAQTSKQVYEAEKRSHLCRRKHDMRFVAVVHISPLVESNPDGNPILPPCCMSLLYTQIWANVPRLLRQISVARPLAVPPSTTWQGASTGSRSRWAMRPRRSVLPVLHDPGDNVEQWTRDGQAYGNFKVLGIEIGHLQDSHQAFVCVGGVFTFLLIYGYMQVHTALTHAGEWWSFTSR